MGCFWEETLRSFGPLYYNQSSSVICVFFPIKFCQLFFIEAVEIKVNYFLNIVPINFIAALDHKRRACHSAKVAHVAHHGLG